jgi:hypothetical protein
MVFLNVQVGELAIRKLAIQPLPNAQASIPEDFELNLKPEHLSSRTHLQESGTVGLTVA